MYRWRRVKSGACDFVLSIDLGALPQLKPYNYRRARSDTPYQMWAVGQSSARGAKVSAFCTLRTLALCALGVRVKNYLQLNLSLLYWILIAPFTGQFFKISPIFRQMVFIGVRAAPMVALTAFSVGVTLAMQAAHSLESLGAEMYIPDLVMLTLLREMGPVLIAVIVIGRSG